MADRLFAELATEEAAAHAIRTLRAAGCRVEAYAPFPSHVIEDAFEARPSRLPIVVFVAGLCGAAGAYLLQWLLVARLYPLVVGMRPPHAPLPFTIITFEMTVLLAGVTAFVATLVAGRLVRLVDDVQGTPGFESVTRDSFWLVVSGDVTPDRLRELGAIRVEAA